MVNPADIREAEIYGTPSAKEVGTCEACSGVIYDYELDKCKNPSCEKRIHHGCADSCDECSGFGCKACLKEIDGLLYCEGCKTETESERPVTFVEVDRAATEKLS